MIRTASRGSTYKFTIFTFLAVLLYSASSAMAQQPAHPMMGGMPDIPTVELTEKSAKNAIDTYLLLREKYGDKLPPADQARATAEGAKALAGMNAMNMRKARLTGKSFKAANLNCSSCNNLSSDCFNKKKIEKEWIPKILE